MAVEATSGERDGRAILSVSKPLKDLSQRNLPLDDEIEITVLGINESVGESIVVHIGSGEWVIIDCCKTRDGINLPLYYLSEIGADLSKVLRVACTHLHSDHIVGLSEVLDRCKNSRFAYSMVGDHNSLKYVIAQYKKDANLPNEGTFGEFMKCIDIVKKQRRKVVPIGLDQPIFADPNRKILGISPSINMNEMYQWKLLRYNLNDPIPSNLLKTNFCSVASILLIGKVHAILGADLESNRRYNEDIEACKENCNRKSKRGWCNVFQSSQYFLHYKYDYIKISHHSSSTGYCPLLWEQFMSHQSIGSSTIFVQGKNALPSQEMINKYADKCSELYYTSKIPTSIRDKKGRSILDDKKKTAIIDMCSVQEGIGVISSRRKIDGSNSWVTDMYESAIRVK